MVSGGGILSSHLEDTVRKILEKNSDWPGLISLTVPGPIRGLSQKKGRMAVKQAQIIGTKRLLSVVLNALQGPAGQEAPLSSLVFLVLIKGIMTAYCAPGTVLIALHV